MLFLKSRWLGVAGVFVLFLALISLYTNMGTADEYHDRCVRNSSCQNILNAISSAHDQDRAANVTPLTPGEVLELAANRLGYGTSPVDQSFLPDRMTAHDLPKVAWIIYSQIYGEDPTLRRVANQSLLREKAIGQDLTHHALHNPDRSCLRDPLMLLNDNDRFHDFVNMPSRRMNEQSLALRHHYLNKSNRTGCENGPRHRLGYTSAEITAKKELIESVFSTQYVMDRRVHDLQMNVQKKVHEFWFNHFNIDTWKSGRYGTGRESFENTITRFQNSSFRLLLGAVTKHPGMLTYLDNDSNVYIRTAGEEGPSNQNLGRELLELHTFGMGPSTSPNDSSPYNQIDVEVASTVLTGHNLRDTATQSGYQFGYHFFPARSFNGSYHNHFWVTRAAGDRPLFFNETRLLGLDAIQSPIQGRLDYLLDLLASHPVTARNICRKLNAHFVRTGLVSHFMSDCRALFLGGGNNPLQALYQNLVSKPAFWSRENAHKMVANPVEVVIKNVRAVGLLWSDVHRLQNSSYESSKLWELATFMDRAIMSFGFRYRHYGAPTGYPMAGHQWLSKGFIMTHAQLAMEYAQLDRSLGINRSAERRFTTDESILSNMERLDGLSNAAINQLLFGSVRGVATVRNRLTSAQISVIKDLLGDQESWDQVRSGTRLPVSFPDTLLSLGKTTMNELKK
jgi:hypothetical protein